MAECCPCGTHHAASTKHLYGEEEDITAAILGRATTDRVSTKPGHRLKDTFGSSQQERLGVSEIPLCGKKYRKPKHA